MDLDPNNPVFKLCVQGMQAEFQGQHSLARQRFEQAWQLHRDDLEACVAAHYLARQQEDPQHMLYWNALALEHAGRSTADLDEFWPSLYLNMGWSYEQLGQPGTAASWYGRAGEALAALPAGGYRDTVAQGIHNGLLRVQTGQPDTGAEP